MHALPEILVVPVVFAHHYYGWGGHLGRRTSPTVTSWYVDETGYLGPEEVSGNGRTIPLVKMSFG